MYYVYLMASRKNGTLYLGVTNNLVRRISGLPRFARAPE